jgi:hypothetical protein
MVGIGQARRLHSIGPITAAILLAMLFASPRSARAGWAFDTIPSNSPVEPPADAIGAATYTFETPTFPTGITTPMPNRAPNSSSVVGFLASFTSAPTIGAFQVNSFQPNSLIVAQSLFNATFPADTLTITFNQPVASLSFNFATDTNQGTGRIQLNSSSGNMSQNSANVGGTYPGGTFTFAPATPFTSISLKGFADATTANGVPIDIDNLTLNIVPEPASLGLVVIGLAALRRRKTN